MKRLRRDYWPEELGLNHLIHSSSEKGWLDYTFQTETDETVGEVDS